MAKLEVNNMSLRGICCALPTKACTVEEIGNGYFDKDVIEKTTKSIGAKKVYIAKENQTAADLGIAASEKLIEELNWNKDTIDGVLFISQTPDYVAPATACIIQNKLGLSINCVALDVNLGCSGFVYGLFLASQFVETGSCRRVLIIVGDTLRKDVSREDRGLTFIISDGVSATAVERKDNAGKISFSMFSDGSGAESLIIPAGGARMPKTELTSEAQKGKDGNIRTSENLYMDGMAIFTFAVKNIPPLINELKEMRGWGEENVRNYLLHQANAYMVKYIAKRAKVPEDKILINIDKYGNTSGATLPFLICDFYGNRIKAGSNAILAGFGIGLSWGGVALTFEELGCNEIIFV